MGIYYHERHNYWSSKHKSYI